MLTAINKKLHVCCVQVKKKHERERNVILGLLVWKFTVYFKLENGPDGKLGHRSKEPRNKLTQRQRLKLKGI
jgi:hypothetical protein